MSFFFRLFYCRVYIILIFCKKNRTFDVGELKNNMLK